MKTETTHFELACRLTSRELQQRKETVIASLKEKLLNKTGTAKGYLYEFAAEDETVEEVLDFIKTERLCCPFFSFKLNIPADAKITLMIEGSAEAVEFLKSEIEL